MKAFTKALSLNLHPIFPLFTVDVVIKVDLTVNGQKFIYRGLLPWIINESTEL